MNIRFCKKNSFIGKSNNLIKKKEIIGILFIPLVIIIIGSVCFLWGREFSLSSPIENDVFGQFGDFIGGIVGALLGIMSVILLYNTLMVSKQQIRMQQIEYQKQQIESRFFELLRIHIENVNKIQSSKHKSIFEQYIKNINNLYEIVKTGKIEHNSKMPIQEIVGLAYLIFFYGLTNKESRNTIIEVMKQANPDSDLIFADELLGELVCKLDTKLQKLTGHELELGCYFRNLYQIVKYINNQSKEILSYQEKYNYIKMLRAQLTAYEQILLFWNSISPLGASWETKKNKSGHSDKNDQLITKYNLIKNIPAKFAEGEIKPNEMYPEVEFDWIKTPSSRDNSVYF